MTLDTAPQPLANQFWPCAAPTMPKASFIVKQDDLRHSLFVPRSGFDTFLAAVLDFDAAIQHWVILVI